MAAFRLRLSAPATPTAAEARSSFYWLTDSSSSFSTSLGPNLGSLGPVPDLNVDLVRIAATVFAADRSVLRAGRGSDWNQRTFELEIPVSATDAWSAVSNDLEGVISFLTGDSWSLTFNDDEAPPEEVAMATTRPKRVVLLSGGADSAIGALMSRADLADDEQHILLSQFSAKTLAPTQRAIADQLVMLLPGPGQEHKQIRFGRNQKRLDGSKYPTEPSSRSRSLLFLALGLAAASLSKAPLWIPENGFASLNPPLSPDRRGSLSTRTTHPAFLAGLVDVLNSVGAHSSFGNPFADSTKGEMFKQAATLVGAGPAASLLSETNSCAHTGQRSFGISPKTPCGVCFGCVIRRASFHTAGLQDATTYISSNGDAGVQSWLDRQSVIPAARSFVALGVSRRDLIALNLPPSYPLAGALDLCSRGIAELSGFLG